MLFLTVSRYLSRLFFCWFLGSAGVFTALILLFDLSELQRRSASRISISFSQKLEMVFLKVPFLVEQLLPFLVFASALGFFWKLNRNCELIALRASGFSSWQICFSPIIIVLGIGFFDLLVIQPLSTEFLKHYHNKNAAYFEQRPLQSLSISPSGLWVRKNEPRFSVVYQIRNLKGADQHQVLENVSVYVFSHEQRLLASYNAQEVALFPEHMILKNVWILGSGVSSQFMRECVLPFRLTLRHIYNSSPDPQLISFWKLSDIIALLNQAGVSSHKYSMQKSSLWARALWLGAMVLLAAAFSFRPLRKGRTFILLILGGMSCFLLYIIRDITYTLGAAGTLPLFLSAWAPFILTFLMAVALLFHFEEIKM